MKKLCKPVSILLSFIMVFSLFTIIPFEVGAAGNGYDLVEYYTRSWDGSKVVEEHLAQATEDTVGKGGAVLINADNSSLDYAGANPGYEYWYYCDRNMTISGRLNVNSGTVNLILCDGARLNLGLGITVGENATLNIYGQKNNTGTLYCHIDKDNKDNGGYAIIGGGSNPNTGTINIHGGKLDLHTDGEIWGYRGACIGGGENGSPKAVTVYGGILELYSTGGACIGGGKYGAASRGDGNGVRIYGGTVNAKSDTGAGIGSGYNCGSSSGIIAIYGGTVTATGRNGGAGIGGGSGSSNCPISIYGGNVTASGIASKVTGSGIGSGRKADQSSSINISGGVVVATGQSGAGIGAAAGGNAGTINISGAVVTASSTAGGAGIGGGKRVDKKGGSGGNTTVSNGSVVVATSSSYGSAQDFNNRLGQTISSSGMKTDASAYTVSAASAVSLLIDLFDKKNSGTGIGGGYQGYAGNITIDNSTVTAKSGKNAAAIGSGDDAANGGEIVITNHSTVTATAGDNGAGIGGGNETKVNRIIINHSTVTSYGGDYAAGIGGGDAADGGFIELSESDVHAYGGKDGAGIGGGEGGYGGTIRIYESKVYAEGKHYGAGIGGGEDEGVREVSVVGNCEVEAVAGSAGNGVAIGHGDFNKFWAWLTQNYPSNGTLSFDQKYYKVNAGSSKGGASLYTHDNTGNLSSVCQNKKYAKIYSCEHNDGTIMDYVSDRYHGQCCSYCGRIIQDLESHNWNSDNVCTVCGASANLIHVVFVERDNNGEVARTVTMPRGYAYKLPESQKTPDGMQLYYWVDERGHEYQIGDEIVCEEKTYTAVYMPAVETTYIDQNGIQQSVTAIRLPKENCNLYTGWYIADYDTYDDEIGAKYRMYGDVNVIIADDVTWSNKTTKFYNYSDGEATFSLYGQKKQNGTFEYGGTSIGEFYNFIQYGGILKTGDIITENDFTFVGGSIDAHSVTAPNKIELGWTRWEDSIYIGYFYKSENSSASGYPEIVVAEGRPLINERDHIMQSGKQGNSQIHMMQGYILSPYPDLSYARNPEWTWSDDGREAEALFTCPSNRDEDAVLQANITYAYEGIYRISTATVTFRNTTYTATKSVRIYWDVNMGSCEHGTMEFSSNSALTGSKVQVTVTPDKGYAVKSFEVIPSDNSSVVEVENNEFTMPDCSVIVNAEFVPVVPRIEPYIDENGEYHLGEVEYAEIDGAPYSVNADGSVGELLDSIELSYFDFALINNDSEYQIKYYTGPKGELSELVIPKTFNGKPITVLGSNTTDPLINYGDTPKTQFTLVLNENIREIKNHTFYTMWVKKVDGDTSNLSILGNYAFSWANSPDGYSLDIKLDYDGVINMGKGVFNNMNVTARMKHAASFTSYNLEQNRLSCIFTDAHLYDEPTWRWGESYNSASAVLACSDPRCDHEETAEAAITIDSRVDKTVYTAAATISGSTYTDVRTVTRTLSNISIADTEYGTITANRTEAYEGEEITLTADPDPFRELSTLSVKDSNNHDIEVTDNKFIMPDSDVTVQATFKKKTIGIEYVTSGHGTVTGPDTARPNERVLLTITADEGWALNNLYAEEEEWNDPVEIIDNKLVMIDGLVTVYADFIPITPKTEPYIDENGEYHLGNIAYYESDGRYYAVENGFIGDQVDSVEFSYFDFTPIYYGTEYRIDHYTGPKEELSELVIPKSYDGKPITVLGNNTNDPLINYGDTPKTQFTLTLNENIREIKSYAFYTMGVTEVKGDTSNLSTLGDFAFSWANSSGDYTLDFKFDYKYKIDIERSVFNHMKVTARIKHATSFSSTDFGAQRVEYIFTDEHTYGDPVWTWTDDYSTATAKFTCADSRCKHEETVNAAITSETKDGIITYTATAELDGNTYNDVKTAFADGVGVRIVGHSISLDGDIAVNFYMDLSDSIIAHKDTAYMHFTIPTGSGTTEQDMLVKDARVVESGDKTYYVFKCRVAAKEMTSEIKAQMIDGENEGVIYTYSVKEYADYLLTHAHEREDLAAAAPLVKKMLNYGAYAQIYFDKNPGTLANSDLAAADKAFSDPEIDIAAPDESKLPEGVTFEGATLSLKSETTLSLYFKSSDPLEFSCDGYTVEKTTSGGYQIARIRGIKAKHIGDVLTLKIGGEETISYSPLNYCKNVLDDDSTDEKLQNVVKALYAYWQVAYIYFES